VLAKLVAHQGGGERRAGNRAPSLRHSQGSAPQMVGDTASAEWRAGCGALLRQNRYRARRCRRRLAPRRANRTPRSTMVRPRRCPSPKP
jgi:hypothetical protein